MSVRLWNLYFRGRAKQVFDQKSTYKKGNEIVFGAEPTKIGHAFRK